MPNPIPTEKAITNAIIKRIKTYPNTWYVKTQGSPRGRAGIPDLLICCAGQFVALEVKRPSVGKVTPLQAAQIKQIRTAGGVAAIVDNVAAACHILEIVLAENGTGLL